MNKNQPQTDSQTWTQRSPFGELIISAGGKGVSYVHLKGARRANGAAPATEAPLAQRAVSEAFERYFAGDAHALNRVEVDLSGARSEFQRKVLLTLRKMVRPGMTISYGELAEAVGHPGAARAVGTAMATNPVAIILPCHRVLASDGTLGGYGGGLAMKRALLRMEGATFRKEGRR